MPKFNTKLVKISRSGPDGNAFVVMGRCQTALRDAGATDDDIQDYLKEAKSGNYEHLLAVSAEWCKFKATR